MADNGITMLSCKIRLMPARLLLLCRFFMRLDNVLFRIRDTRVYADFSTGEVIREYIAKEEDYEAVRVVSTATSEQARSISNSIHLETCSHPRRCIGTNEGSQPDSGTLARRRLLA